VLPGSTGSALGLSQGDVVLQINQTAINSPQDLVSKIRTLAVGDALKVAVKQGPETQTLSGELLGRPPEQHPDFEVVYDQVTVGQNHLRSMVYKPHDLKPGQRLPALYYIQGYTCGSVDHSPFMQLTLQQLLNEVVLNGFVVYKIEKFGVGDSVGPLRCDQVDFSTELTGFAAGLQALKAYDFVDPQRVYVFGHSLGGLVAPLLAQKHDLKGLSVYGSVVEPWYDYLLKIFGEQAQLFGTDAETAANNAKLIQPLLHAWLKTDRHWDDIVADPQYAAALESGLMPHSGDQVFNRHHSFFKDLNQYDFKQAWANYAGAVLAMHGEYDIQAINADWLKDIAQAAPQAVTQIIPKSEHSLLRYESREALMTAMQNGTFSPANPGDHYSREVAKTLLDWLKKTEKN
jgi:pimeloyl-ACP methyl ester carboxylesterase